MGARGAAALWGLLRVGLGGRLAHVPRNSPAHHGDSLWKAVLPPGCSHLFSPVPSPSPPAGFSSVNSFSAPAGTMSLSLSLKPLAQITDSRTLEVRGSKAGETEAQRRHGEYNSSRAA